MINQKGNATLAAALMLSSLSAWSILYLKNEARIYKQIKGRLRTYTCMKELNGEVKEHVFAIEKLNRAIDGANAVMAASTVKPPVYAAAKAAKKAAQALQQGKHIDYLRVLFGLAQKRCLFDPSTYKTPYAHKGALSRDSLGRAKLRREKWSQISFGSQVLLRTKIKNKGFFGKTKMESESWEIEEGMSLLKSL